MKFSKLLVSLLPVAGTAATTCNTGAWSSGLRTIQSSVEKLSSDIAVYGTGTPPCSSINLTKILADVTSLIGAITKEANAIGSCSTPVSRCGNLQAYVTSTFIPKVGGLSSVLVARRKQVCCNNLSGLVGAQAKSIGSAVSRYGSSITPKISSGACRTLAANDISSIQKSISGIVASVTC